MERAVERTPHRVEAVHTLDRLADLFRRGEPQGDANTTDDEHAVLGFDLARDLGGQATAVGIDVARLQRASKGADHSTGCCGDHVVDRRGVRFCELGRIDFVMLGDRAVHAERDRLGLARQVGDPQRPLPAFDADPRLPSRLTSGVFFSRRHHTPQVAP